MDNRICISRVLEWTVMPKVVPAKSGPTRPLLACQKWTLDHFWSTKTGPPMPKHVLVPIRLGSHLLALYRYIALCHNSQVIASYSLTNQIAQLDVGNFHKRLPRGGYFLPKAMLIMFYSFRAMAQVGYITRCQFLCDLHYRGPPSVV